MWMHYEMHTPNISIMDSSLYNIVLHYNISYSMSFCTDEELPHKCEIGPITQSAVTAIEEFQNSESELFLKNSSIQ